MNHPLILDLPPLVAERLEATCTNTGRTTASHVLEALDWYFDELREVRAAEEGLERIRTCAESTRSLDDIAADLGLNKANRGMVRRAASAQIDRTFMDVQVRHDRSHVLSVGVVKHQPTGGVAVRVTFPSFVDCDVVRRDPGSDQAAA